MQAKHALPSPQSMPLFAHKLLRAHGNLLAGMQLRLPAFSCCSNFKCSMRTKAACVWPGRTCGPFFLNPAATTISLCNYN